MTLNVSTQDPLVSPVTEQELADWTKLDVSDPVLAPMLLTATALVIEHIKRDLISRAWNLTYWQWPINGTVSRGLSHGTAEFRRLIKLRYYGNQVSVTEVKIRGEATTDYTLQTDSLYFEYLTLSTDPDVKDLEVTYTTGYGTANDVPSAIKTAIKQLATYLYQNRGCDSSDAIKKSGAAATLTHYRAAEAMVL